MEKNTCPMCGNPLGQGQLEQIQKKLETEVERKLTDKMALRQKELEAQATLLSQEKIALIKEKGNLEEKALAKVQEILKEREKEIAATASKAYQEQVATTEAKLLVYEAKELDWLKKQREIEEKERTLELEVQRKITEQSKEIWEQAAKAEGERLKLEMAERDKKIEALNKNLEDMQRKLRDGSAQAEGAIHEEELEAELGKLFPGDSIEPVPNGKRGGDILQQVIDDKFRRPCGSILWERKDTQAWQDGWLAKLRADQRECGADAAIIVTRVLPKGVTSFTVMESVVVTNRELAPGIAVLLRQYLQNLSAEKVSQQMREQKTDLLYRYATSTEFTQKLAGVVDAYQKLQANLDKERRAFEKIWKEREKEYRTIVLLASQIYGDVSGIVGALPPIEGLELPGGGNGNHPRIEKLDATGQKAASEDKG